MKPKTTTIIQSNRIAPNSTYKPEYARIAYKLAKRGSTNRDIYEILGISEQLGIEWKKRHGEFKEALAKGREEMANILVEKSLMKLALGHEKPVEKALVVADGQGLGSHIEKVSVREYYPPNINAVKYFLNNRKPVSTAGRKGWAEKQIIEHQIRPGYKVIADDEQGDDTRQTDMDEDI